MIKRLLNTATLPLNSAGKLKIYSSLPTTGGFRLSNGSKFNNNLAIIGATVLDWKDCNLQSVKCVLEVLRPLPEIVIISGTENDKNDNASSNSNARHVNSTDSTTNNTRCVNSTDSTTNNNTRCDTSTSSNTSTTSTYANWKELQDEFGCSVEVFENKMTAASTFNTLIDDDRRVIAFFKFK